MLQGRVSLPCFCSFLRVRGAPLTKLHLTTNIVLLSDLILLRKFSPNLEVLEGRFTVVSHELMAQQLVDYNPQQVG